MSATDHDFRLSPAERAHPLWLGLKGHLEVLLRDARGKLEDETLTEPKAAAFRGRINLLKALIALGDEMPPLDG